MMHCHPSLILLAPLKLRELGYDKEIMTLEDAVKDYLVNYLEKGSYLGDE